MTPEELRKRAVELGNDGSERVYVELISLYQSPYPMVRRAAASGLAKVLERRPDLAQLVMAPLTVSLTKEEAPQVLQYALKALRYCAPHLNIIALDDLNDIARDPTRKDYVRKAASEVIAAVEIAKRKKAALLKHWCSRCRKIITPEESAAGIDKYGKPYCRHCLDEKIFEDANFTAKVEDAKRLRTTDGVAVQSAGEKRIGSCLERMGIKYEYDERYLIARDTRIRPDFYLPEFDLYIEYWGMNTPEYIENMKRKRFLYQQARKKLISISWQDLENVEEVLREKLSRYINI